MVERTSLKSEILSESEKHQIILSVNHHVTRLLIKKAHRDTLHDGPALVMSALLCEFGSSEHEIRCVVSFAIVVRVLVFGLDLLSNF